MLGVGLRDVRVNVIHHRLAVSHFFRSFGDSIYVLRPHLVELWAYVRRTVNHINARPELQARALGTMAGLSPSIGVLFDSLGGRELTQTEEQQLLDVVTDEFGNLCLDVDEFLTLMRHSDRLLSLFEGGRLKTSMTPLLRGLELDDQIVVKHIDAKEALLRFPSDVVAEKRLTKLTDARALVELRELNGRLNSAGAHLILVTRDEGMLDATRRLAQEEWLSLIHI